MAWIAIKHPDYRDGQLSAQGSLLLLAYAEHVADDRAEIFTSDAVQATWVGRSRTWVRRHRRALVEAGLMRRIGPSGRGRLTRWALFPIPEVDTTGVQPADAQTSHNVVPTRDVDEVDTTSGAKLAHRGARSWHTGVDQNQKEPGEPLTRDEGEREDARATVDETEAVRNVLEVLGGRVVAVDA